jgi:uncharacterized tellurite resistance protein B-like protein
MFSKAFGTVDYTRFAGFYEGDLSALSIVNEKYNSYLKLKLAGKDYTIKLSSFEVKDCEPIVEKWRQVGAKINQPVPPSLPPEAAVPPAPEPGAFTTMTGLIAALLFIASTDREIVAEEEEYIKRICYNQWQYLEDGQKYYNEHSYEELLAALGGCDHQQKLCILANMVEVAMCDGAFNSDQQRMIRQYVQSMGLTQDEYDAVRDVLLIKNQVSVLVP